MLAKHYCSGAFTCQKLYFGAIPSGAGLPNKSLKKACSDKDKSLHLQPLRKRGDVRVIECGESVEGVLAK